MNKTTRAALAVMTIMAIVSGCGKASSRPAESAGTQSPFASFRDIPGVTAEEIAAIETLRGRYDHFVYGVAHTTEAFPVYTGQDNESGTYTVGGYTARLCEWLTGLFDIPFRPTFYEWSTLISGLESGDVHFIGDLMATEERRKTHFMTSTISERFLKSFHMVGTRPITDIAKSRPPRLVFTHGFAPFDYVSETTEYVFEPIFVSDLAEAYQMLKRGEADAFLTMNTAEPELDLYGDVISETFYPLVFSAATLSTQTPDLKPVISVVQKALDNGGTSYLTELYSQGRRDFIKNKFLERLTHEEFEYIQRNAIVRVATETDNYPISFYNNTDKELQGIAFDVMREIESITGLSFKIVNALGTNYRDLTNMVVSGEASMLTLVMRSKERESYFFLPETPVMRAYSNLISKSEFPDIQFNQLSNVTVGIVRGTVQDELFKRWFPDNKIFREYDNMDSVFSALERGEVDMLMSMENYLLSIENYKELAGYKANVIFDNHFDITFGFNKNEATLCSIVDKALALIDLKAISGDWTSKRYDYRAKVAEARLPWLLGATAMTFITLALIVILLYRNLNLRKLKKAEAEAREADERAHIIFDTAPFASCMFDKDFNLLDCNQEIVKMLGIPDKEYFLKRHSELSPEYQPCGELSVEKSAKENHIAFEKGYHRFEWMHRKLNGEFLPVEITLVRVKYKGEYAIAGYIRDLTEQKAAEQLTKIVTEKTSTLKAILDATPDLIFCKDLNLRYTEINKAMETHSNRLRSDVIGKNDAEALWIPSDLMAEYNALDRKIINEKQTVAVEEYIETFDGERPLFETIKTPLIQDGKVTGLVGISRDITQRKAMEELAKQQAEAEAANHAKSAFLASMSHEIRTPMNAILGITEIQLQNKLSADTRDALNIIYNSGYTLLGIINDLLDLSRIEAGKLELMNDRYETASMINDTINLNTAHIGSKQIEFKLYVDEYLPFELIGDELRVKQILNNLLSNAFKYTNKGEVSLSFSAQTSDEDLAGSTPSVTLNIIVRDTGQGMTEEQIRDMFDAYSRFNLKANRYIEGTGLGMNIVQQLVKKMHGDISVNSEPGKGTEIIVHLIQGYASPTKLGKELAENLRGFRLFGTSKMKKAQIVREPMPYGKVLVVDDMETNLYVARGFLLPYGLTIDTALSGMEAIEKIEHGNVYDIVFMDHMMPVMDGIEAVKIMRAKGYMLPIVALTANAVSGQAEMFMGNGFDGFISKPIDIREMNTSLNKFVRDRHTLEEIETARAAYGEGDEIADTVPQLGPELVKIFARDAEKAIAVLQGYEDAYGSDNLQAYITNVHALKSALANIGETDLSGFARELEQAGRDRRIAFISEKTSAFLNELRTVVDKLKAKEKEYDVGDVSDEDKAYLRKMLLTVKEACAVYDTKTARDALTELKQKPWPGAYGELLDTIAGYLLHSDFEEAEGACAAYLSKEGHKNES
jgi:PAS domain S-box-containing protein